MVAGEPEGGGWRVMREGSQQFPEHFSLKYTYQEEGKVRLSSSCTLLWVPRWG